VPLAGHVAEQPVETSPFRDELAANSHALYLKAPLVAKRTLNKAIFAKLYVDDLGSEPVVASDELSEPFATIVGVHRALVPSDGATYKRTIPERPRQTS
jgi:hypothetical protein